MKSIVKTVSVIAFLLCVNAMPIWAQNDPQAISQKFFADFEANGASVALDQFYSSNQWMMRATDAISNLKSQMEGLTEDFVGSYYGYVLIAEKRVTDRFALVSYIALYDRQPIRFTFQYYKPKDKWISYSFEFDANLDDELEEAAKVYNLD